MTEAKGRNMGHEPRQVGHDHLLVGALAVRRATPMLFDMTIVKRHVDAGKSQ
ncbi:MAG TPA: hypothetical protein VJ301_03485 [Propionibacteriaceae bacterium]|nr:hypothetical protein [Propionibacteriaceae bacterium]